MNSSGTLLVVILFQIAFSSHKVNFNPGTTSSFDFITILPELKESLLYKKYCVQQTCNFTVYKAFSDKASDGSTRFDTKFMTDEGSYILSVRSNEIGFIFPRVLQLAASYLYMENLKDYLSLPLPKLYKRGRTVVVPCPVLGDPQPTVTWSKRVDDNKLVEIVNDGDKYTITKLGHLFISNYSDNDTGRYFCSAENSCSRRLDESACDPVSLQSSDYVMSITKDDSHKFSKLKYYYLNPKNTKCWLDRCYQYGTYSTMNMYISLHGDVNVEVFVNMHSNSSYDGAKIYTEYNSPRFVIPSVKICNGVLRNYTYKDVQLNSVDCAAYFPSGILSTPIARYRLSIVEPPHIRTNKSSAEIQYGSNYTVVFSVEKGHRDNLGLPFNISEVMCFKNGESFKMKKGWHKQCSWDPQHKTVSLSLKCATVTDTGYYQVGATNIFGSRIGDPIYLDVIDDKKRTKDCYPLSSTVLSPTEVKLSWNTPPTEDSTLIYEIKLDNVMWKEDPIDKHVKETASRIKGLSPGTLYNAIVKSNGELVGQRITFRTHQTVPSAAPVSVHCAPIYSRLQCSWKKIPIEARNGDITFYKVKFRWYHGWEVNDSSVEYLKSQTLRPDTKYTIQVMGCTIAGCGPHITTTATTTEDLPRYAPLLRYVYPGKDNIRLGWDRPFGSFKQITYTVKCKERKHPQNVIFLKNVTELDAIVAGNNVHESTKYVLTVTPYSSQGHGPSMVKEVTTLSYAIRNTFSLVLLLIVCLFEIIL